VKAPYFSYGSNMAINQMAARCPTAMLLGKARLPHFEFRIARSGYATIVPRRHGVVHGVLWLLGREDARALDAYEEVEQGLYRKITCAVERDDGRRLSALIYVAAQPSPGRALRGYIDAIIGAAIEHGLPPDAVAAISRWRR
jgi:hypothetical protein